MKGQCYDIDQPAAALIKDLKARGLLDETLVMWTGEFGRTPVAQGKDGRDHNPHGFTYWMAGGGVKGGFVFGASDNIGATPASDAVTPGDVIATMYHR